MTLMNTRDIIAIERGKRSGKPCIRGLRIPVCERALIPSLSKPHPELVEG